LIKICLIIWIVCGIAKTTNSKAIERFKSEKFITVFGENYNTTRTKL